MFRPNTDVPLFVGEDGYATSSAREPLLSAPRPKHQRGHLLRVGAGLRRRRITDLEARVAAATGLNQLLQAGPVERSHDPSPSSSRLAGPTTFRDAGETQLDTAR